MIGRASRKIESPEGFIASHAWVVDREDRIFSRVSSYRKLDLLSLDKGNPVRVRKVSFATSWNLKRSATGYGNPRLIFIFEPNERAEGIAWRGGTEREKGCRPIRTRLSAA